MKYSYAQYRESMIGHTVIAYRIQDSHDGRVATCYVEENARLVVDRMNKGELAPHLAIALRALLAAFKPSDLYIHAYSESAEASRALAEWDQLNKL